MCSIFESHEQQAEVPRRICNKNQNNDDNNNNKNYRYSLQNTDPIREKFNTN